MWLIFAVELFGQLLIRYGDSLAGILSRFMQSLCHRQAEQTKYSIKDRVEPISEIVTPKIELNISKRKKI